MTFGELRDDFRMKLNRRDITPTQVDAYLKASIQRTQRLLRTPASETVAIYHIGSEYTLMPVPGNYLKLVSMRLNDDHEITRADLSTVLKAARYSGCTNWFCRDGGNFILGPKPTEGDKITIIYHTDFSDLVSANDYNWLTEVAPDVVVNGALAAACRTYVDPRRDSYEGDFLQAITDLNMQAADDELLNSSISPCNSFD